VAAAPAQPIFYYDIGDPDCYVLGERIMADLLIASEWEPVHGPQIGWTPPAVDEQALAQAVADQGLLPLRLPRGWPPDSELAMLAATFAKRGGKAVAFSLAAFRQAFAAGRDLADEGTVLIAAAACEMHPTAVLKGVEMRSVVGALREAGDRARRAGVHSLPAIEVDGAVFQGPGALARATAALTAGGGPDLSSKRAARSR
jgi:hypothetical protein